MSEIDYADLQIDVYRSGILQPCAVRITHRPTGIVVQAQDRSQLEAREQAMQELHRRLS